MGLPGKGEPSPQSQPARLKKIILSDTPSGWKTQKSSCVSTSHLPLVTRRFIGRTYIKLPASFIHADKRVRMASARLIIASIGTLSPLSSFCTAECYWVDMSCSRLDKPKCQGNPFQTTRLGTPSPHAPH